LAACRGNLTAGKLCDVAHKGRLRALPVAVLATVVVLCVVALTGLLLSRNPAIAAEVDGAAVAVCGFAWSAAVFLLPRLRVEAPAPDGAKVAAMPVAVPAGLLPAVVRARSPELRKLRQLLRKPRGEFVVLAGMGGVGKSTIATAFADHAERARVRWRRADVWFVSAADASSLTGGLAAVARDLGASPADVEAIGAGGTDAPDTLWRLLQAVRRRWLLVLDNADDPAVLARPLPVMVQAQSPGAAGAGMPADGTGWVRPARRGLIVVTSRNGDLSCWGRHARLLTVRPLEGGDAARVLLDRAPHAGDAAQARALGCRLGGLPLALRIAGSYLSSGAASVASFSDYEVELMLTRRPELKAAVGDREIPVRTFEISLDDLSRRGVPQARPLLRLLSCYAAPSPVPLDLLDADLLRGILASGGQGNARHDLECALQGLGDLGLIEFARIGQGTEGWRGVTVHPVVADANREHLRAADSVADSTLVCRTAVQLLGAAVGPLDVESPAHWPAFFSYGLHLHALFETTSARLDGAHAGELLRAATMTAHAHHHCGAVSEAKRLAQAVLARLMLLPADDADSLRTQHYIAWFLGIQGQLQDAGVMYRDVLAARIRLLGPDDPETLLTRHELAWIAACEERWAEAEAAYRQVLHDWCRVCGDKHPWTLMTRHELGWAISNQGRAQEAEQLLAGVLAARQEVLGEEHPRTLWTHHELAWAIACQGRWREAEAIYRMVLEARRRLLRPNHPALLTTIQELAWVTASQGHSDAALGLYREVLEARRVILGDDDPDTLATFQAVNALRAGHTTVPRHIA
jgi:tetratricopeptide (TPR) repeat protein